MAQRGSLPPSSRSRELAGEDFLYHLYRGSELLQDNRVHDAKAEIEQALSLQPSDPKGQDLLGIVYFRLGLYPRAISIYEDLIRSHPDAIEPRINLALSYLKTGQPSQARFELEKVVEHSPGHSRAWGYLGLAFQRLGDYDRASYAFSAGGHDGMARRLVDVRSGAPGGPMSVTPEPGRTADGDLGGSVLPPQCIPRRDTRAAHSEDMASERPVPVAMSPPLDATTSTTNGDIRGSAVSPTQPSSPQANPEGERPLFERTSARFAGRLSSRPSPRTFESVDPRVMSPARTDSREPTSASAPTRPARRLLDLCREALLVYPRDLGVSRHTSGLVLARVATGFSTRLEAVRAISQTGDSEATTLQRRMRGRSVDEPLGGSVSPLVEVMGKGELVLGPSAGRQLHPILLENDALYLREDALTGFESVVSYENGRLPLGDGDAVSMVLLRGPGTVVASFPETLASLEIAPGRQTTVRTASVLGWVGHLVPHAVPAIESPGGTRGMTAFAGEGMVLVDGL